MGGKTKKLEANSYCVKYDNEKFFVGLARKNKDKEVVDVKGYMYCNEEDIKALFRSILFQMIKFEKETNRDLIKELLDEIKEGVE